MNKTQTISAHTQSYTMEKDYPSLRAILIKGFIEGLGFLRHLFPPIPSRVPLLAIPTRNPWDPLLPIVSEQTHSNPNAAEEILSTVEAFSSKCHQFERKAHKRF